MCVCVCVCLCVHHAVVLGRIVQSSSTCEGTNVGIDVSTY